MMRKYKSIILLFLFTFPLLSIKAQPIDSLLLILEHTIQNKELYNSIKQNKIKQHKESLGSGEFTVDLYETNKKLINEYNYYKLDSMLKYIELNLKIATKINDQTLIHESTIKKIKILLNAGKEVEALKSLEGISRSILPDSLLLDYFRIQFNLYAQLAYKSISETHKAECKINMSCYFDSLMQIIPLYTGPYLELMEMNHYHNNELNESLSYNTQRLLETDHNSEYYPQINFYRALYYKAQGNLQSAKYFLIQTAIADLKRARKNNGSLTQLAMILAEENDYKRANKYINIAMEDAVYYNSDLRYLFLSKVLPSINNSYQHEVDKKNNELSIYSSLLAIASFLLIIIMYLLYRKNKKLNLHKLQLKKSNLNLKQLNLVLENTNTQLKEANKIKEQYIGNFFDLCTKYIDKLNNYRKMVYEDVINKKTAELIQKTKSDKIIIMERANFYRYFDATFLSIYPYFVEKVNDLIIPEHQIKLKNKELLTPELRLLALTRLGINDSTRIARLLGYSVNTIYNYRAQLKNKLKDDRTLFEDRIMEIDS
ncbi:DUF6377 domain-containing protein [Saccharicrinis aurantiacus]|uniref:DUF6377 domain-containing protein n=1 Tax=Saccharicrinis aurantiacus TaxID=1849719 RepID=UPI00111519F9|nr:DUF6377 domain-containing protein [Saccharicrinis aurantiacus]